MGLTCANATFGTDTGSISEADTKANRVNHSLSNSCVISIAELDTGDKTFSTKTPAVFEVLPKERADLNLFYETPTTSIILKDGMFIRLADTSAVTQPFRSTATIIVSNTNNTSNNQFQVDPAQLLQDCPAGQEIEIGVKDANGDVVYALSNGKTIPGVLKGKDKNGKKLFDAPTVESIIKVEGEGVTLVAARNRLYYGKSDPAYIKAREAAAKNPNIKKAKRVTAKQAGTTEGNNQAVINQDALERVALELESAVANGMPMEFATMIIQGSYQATTGLIKISAPIVARSIDPQFAKEGKPNQTSGKEAFREEHSPPASVIGGSLIWAIKNGQVKSVMEGVRNNYVQVLLSKADDVKIDRAGLDSTLPDGVNIMTPNAGILRFAASGINLNTIVDFKTGKSFAETMNVSVAKSLSLIHI